MGFIFKGGYNEHFGDWSLPVQITDQLKRIILQTLIVATIHLARAIDMIFRTNSMSTSC